MSGAGGTDAEAGVPYWEARAARLGARAVVNLDHPAAGGLDAISAGHRAVLLPLLAGQLTGSERVVVDVGCGTGRFTADLAHVVGGRAIGVDPVASLLALAPLRDGVQYRTMGEGVIPLADDEADVAFTCLVLGGIAAEPLRATASELRRVVRSGGLVFLAESVSEQSDADHWAFRSVEDYRALLPWANLHELATFSDGGDAVTVLAGRAT